MQLLSQMISLDFEVRKVGGEVCFLGWQHGAGETNKNLGLFKDFIGNYTNHVYMGLYRDYVYF